MGDEIYDLKEEDMPKQEERGERVDIKEIIGKSIIIYKYDLRDSQYHDGKYAMIDIDIEGDETIDHKRLLMTSSMVLLEQLDRWCIKMPYRAIIEQRKSDKWKYYSFKPIE